MLFSKTTTSDILNHIVILQQKHLTSRELQRFKITDLKSQNKTISGLADFPGGPVVKTSPSKAGGAGSIPGWGAMTPTCLLAKKPKQKTEAVL